LKVLVFRYMDTNGDGYMDLAELLKVIELPLAEAFSPTVSTPAPSDVPNHMLASPVGVGDGGGFGESRCRRGSGLAQSRLM